MIYERNLESYEHSKKAKKVLDGLKEIEEQTALHECRINSKTVVYCKNKNNIDKYKLKQKREIVCLTDS